MNNMLTPRKALVLLSLAAALNSVASSQTNPLHTTHVCQANTLHERAILNAVMMDDLQSVRRLLRQGVSPDAKDDCEISAVTTAVYGGHVEILAELIDAGADVNQRDNLDNKTPLMWAFNLVNEEGKGKIPQLVHLLLNAGAKVNVRDEDDDTPLILAVKAEIEVVAAGLIAAGADVNARDAEGLTAYSYAAQMGNRRLMSILSTAGANTRSGVKEYKDKFGAAAFIQAATDGRTDILEALLADGTDPNTANQAGATALMRVVNESSLDALLAAGADVKISDGAGFTALHWAALYGRDSHVKKLIAAGADVNAVNNEHETPLDLARAEVRATLLEAGGKYRASHKRLKPVFH